MPPPIPTPPSAAASLEALLGAIPGLGLRAGEPLRAHTTMATGGPARGFVLAETREALIAAIALLRSRGERWMMLGGGSNTLFEDAGYDGVIVKLGRGLREIEFVGQGVIHAGAAASLSSILILAKRHGLSGIEFGVGIPGNLGGALAGNAGAGGEDICSIAEVVEVIGADGKVAMRARGEFEFGYRTSALREEIILGARLRLAPAERREIEARIEAHRARRREQPLKESSSGCMFKNPRGDAAGRLIDACGLKGLRVGGISVSPTHANFMTNAGGGATADIIRLMDLVRARVREKTGVELESEVRVIPHRASS